MCTRKLLKWSWRCIKLYSVKIVRKSLQYMTAMGLHDVIRGEVLSRARSSVFFFFFLFCCAKNRISKSPPFNPPNPHEGRKREQDGWSAVDYPIPIGSIFHEDMTKERCRMTLRWISVNQSLSRYNPSVSWSRTFAFDILSEKSIVHPVPAARARLITTCVARVTSED